MTPPKFIPAEITPGGRFGFGYWSGLPLSGDVTSPFAAYEAIREANGWGSHNGNDIADEDATGDLIRAVYPGVVIWAFGDGVAPEIDEGSVGSFVVIHHEIPGYNDAQGVPIPVFTGYGHLLTTPLVKVGDYVEQGQPIGLVGYSGSVNPPGPTGSHLHFVVMEGIGLFSRQYDTFYDARELIGAPRLPASLPAVGSQVQPISLRQSTELQAIFGKPTIVWPQTVQPLPLDARLEAEQLADPKLYPAGTRASKYELWTIEGVTE